MHSHGRIKTAWQLVWLSLRKSRFLLLAPWLVLYLWTPFRMALVYYLEDAQFYWLYNNVQKLGVAACLAWPLLALQGWYEGDAAEVLQTYGLREKISPGRMVLLADALVMATLLPAVLWAGLAGFFAVWEYLRLLMQVLVFSAILCLLTMLFRSQNAAITLILAYTVFSVLFCGKGGSPFRKWCWILPNKPADPEMLLQQYLPPAVLALLFFALVPLWERKHFRR